ncbi:hypothetical protein Dimus_001335 [Dionaea muscipula]
MPRYRSRSHSRSRSRSRSKSRSRSPSRTPPRRKRYDDPRDRRSYRHPRSPAPSGLLVRNVALDTRPEDLRVPFERFGPVKDVYLPRNYYTGEPRGFGFVKFRHPEDAAEAKERLNHTVIGGREIRIVFAEENRKTPHEMRLNTRISSRYGGASKRKNSSRSPRRRNRSYTRSPSLARRYSRSISRSSSRSEREYRSNREDSPRDISPRDKRGKRTRKGSESPRETSLGGDGYRSSKKSSSSREASPCDEREYRPSKSSPPSEKKRMSTRRSPSLRDHSRKRDYRSKSRSLTPGMNGSSAQAEMDFHPSKLHSPRRNDTGPSGSP